MSLKGSQGHSRIAENSVLCVSWRNCCRSLHQDSKVSADRHQRHWQSKGESIALLVNNRWCNPGQSSAVKENWNCNTEAIYRKRLYILRKLRFFSVSSSMLHIFCGECNLLCSHLLGQQHHNQGLKEAEADREGWLSAGGGSGAPGVDYERRM